MHPVVLSFRHNTTHDTACSTAHDITKNNSSNHTNTTTDTDSIGSNDDNIDNDNTTITIIITVVIIVDVAHHAVGHFLQPASLSPDAMIPYVQVCKPKDFAMQINLHMENCWGIVRAVIDLCLKLDEGKYLIVKEPNKPVMRLYSVPENAFEQVC